MLATPNAPFLQMPPPIPSSVVQGVASGTTLGSIPTQIVPSTISVAEVHNNTQGNNALSNSAANATSSATSLASNTGFTPLTSSIGSPLNLSSPFFAQLLSQSSPSAQTQVTENFLAMPSYNTASPETIEKFVNIKYLPSLAAKPRSKSALAQVTQPDPAAAQRLQNQQIQQQQNEIRVDMAKLQQNNAVATQQVSAAVPSIASVASSAGNAGSITTASANIANSFSNNTNRSSNSNNSNDRVNDVNFQRGVNAYLQSLSRTEDIKPVTEVEEG